MGNKARRTSRKGSKYKRTATDESNSLFQYQSQGKQEVASPTGYGPQEMKDGRFRRARRGVWVWWTALLGYFVMGGFRILIIASVWEQTESRRESTLEGNFWDFRVDIEKDFLEESENNDLMKSFELSKALVIKEQEEEDDPIVKIIQE